jgi:hypothetical protein
MHTQFVNPASNSLAIRRRNGAYCILELTGYPGLYLHDDGITRQASQKALTEAVALCEKWTNELIANRQKKIDRDSKMRYTKHIAARNTK